MFSKALREFSRCVPLLQFPTLYSPVSRAITQTNAAPPAGEQWRYCVLSFLVAPSSHPHHHSNCCHCAIERTAKVFWHSVIVWRWDWDENSSSWLYSILAWCMYFSLQAKYYNGLIKQLQSEPWPHSYPTPQPSENCFSASQKSGLGLLAWLQFAIQECTVIR